MRSPLSAGFTLAELLISLAILGVIATFTIPKILNTQTTAKNNAIAKEVAAMISGAYQQLQLSGKVTTATKPSDLIPYMNYVSVDTSGTKVDATPNWTGMNGDGTNTCNATTPCLKLHNGGVIWFVDTKTLGGTTPAYMLEVAVDPDQTVVGGIGDGLSKSVQFVQYYDGSLTTRGAYKSPTCTSGGCVSGPPDPAYDPSWFKW